MNVEPMTERIIVSPEGLGSRSLGLGGVGYLQK